MAIHCAAAEHDGLIKKERKKVHRQNVRLSRLKWGALAALTLEAVRPAIVLDVNYNAHNAPAYVPNFSTIMPIAIHRFASAFSRGRCYSLIFVDILGQTVSWAVHRPISGASKLILGFRYVACCSFSKQGRLKDDSGCKSRRKFHLRKV